MCKRGQNRLISVSLRRENHSPCEMYLLITITCEPTSSLVPGGYALGGGVPIPNFITGCLPPCVYKGTQPARCIDVILGFSQK